MTLSFMGVMIKVFTLNKTPKGSSGMSRIRDTGEGKR